MNQAPINRRRFLKTALLAGSLAVAADAVLVEPTALEVRRVRIGSAPTRRLVHFSDVHHKGDRPYLESVVSTINSLQPDFTCFTGDIVERHEHLAEALEVFSSIKSPVFGVPGNHDFSSGISLVKARDCFEATGGKWLMNSSHEIPDRNAHIIGAISMIPQIPLPSSRPSCTNILLMHYPAQVTQLGNRTFDLILAGHSHGGQVRLPLWGSLIVPRHVGGYDLGLYDTPAGPLYVNPGIGYLGCFDVRFNCRPEITVIEI